MVKVELDYVLTEELREKIWKNVSTWGRELHRSDCIQCPLKAYNRLTGLESRPSMHAVENWVIGKAIHDVIEGAFDLTEVEMSVMDAVVHFDVMYGSVPLEIKTTVYPMFTPAQLRREYIDQLGYGMVFTGGTHGNLLTLDLLNKMLLAWSVDFTAQEVQDYSRRFVDLITGVKEAVNRGSPNLLKPRYEECQFCEYNYVGGCKFRRNLV